MDTTSVINFKSPPFPFFIEITQMNIAKGQYYPSRSNLETFSILYVRKGTVIISEEHREYSVQAGEYLILKPHSQCSSTHQCSKDTVIDNIQFSAVASWEQLDMQSEQHIYGDYYNHIVHAIKKHKVGAKKKFELTIEKLRLAAASGDEDSFWSRQQYFVALLKLIDAEWRVHEAKASVFVAEKAAAYIKEHYKQNMTNTMLAKDLGYHINYITRCMDEVYKMTPQQYLLFYRLDQGKLLLTSTEWTISSIAKETGFKQTPHFSRLFAAHFGIAPLKYRKKYCA